MEVIVSNRDYIVREALILCSCGCSVLRVTRFEKEDYYVFTWYGTPFQKDSSIEACITLKQMANVISHLQNDYVDDEAPTSINIDRLFFTQENGTGNNEIFLTIGAEDAKGCIDWDISLAPAERQKFIDMMTKWLEEDYNANV